MLLIGGFAFQRLNLKQINSGISWSILLFIFCLALLVKGLDNVGVTKAIGDVVTRLSFENHLGAVMTTTFATALGANLINNWSMMMVSVSSLGTMPSPDQNLIYSAILGADIGPNIAIMGSLSSMLWLVLLRRRGLEIHPLQYLKLGLIVVPPMLVLGALSLYVCSLF